ncbi:magnesium-translocating P-type ATPase [Chryseobacterium koreense]|uniref:magnesium-translocating P-type ATPase n=1 Tax=Chryseobacterium koreense TaxID=232216 RepID=UPI0026EEED43|nr:magnesium-translocating P-type ATPase [Chryseobacterium koreense]
MKLFYKTKIITPKISSGHHVLLLQKISALSPEAAILEMKTSADGLLEEEAKKRLEEYGPNEANYQKAPKWYRQLLNAFLNPFTFILMVIAVISYFVDNIMAAANEKDPSTVIIISIMVVFSGLLRFWQEFRSNRAAEQLKKMVTASTTVKRKNKPPEEISVTQIVPGDLIKLSAGDMVPADCRIIQSKDLFCSEAMLTGEAMPTEKNSTAIPNAAMQIPLMLENLCFMGTNIVSGSATALVLNTATQTYFGQISEKISEKRSESEFEKGVNKVSFLLIRFMLVMVPLIFLINGLIKGTWIEALLFAIAVAVGLIPEMLPMIVTANLSKGSIAMSKKKVIVKHLDAIQNIGAMNILCCDKTGTITKNEIALEKHLNADGNDDKEVLKWAYLNSYFQTGLRNLMDEAVLKHTEVQELINIETDFQKVDEIPFDFERRRMSVILKMKNGKQLLICKGAVEEIIGLCTKSFDPGPDKELHIEQDKQIDLDENVKNKILSISKQMNEEGLRVLLIAIREFGENHPTNYSKKDESELTMTGFIGFLDPAKPSAGPSIEALHQLGVEVKIITGDNDLVAKKVGKDVGLLTEKIMLGEELERLSDEELKSKLSETVIFAKINPMQKLRIVNLLRKAGNTIGFIGDGINDAAALKEADVGISVDSAVDISKESADIILLEKDLMVLCEGVLAGRQTFGNIIKYIKMAASSNFGNMFSMLGASALLPFLPMLPLQIITQNLLYDFSQSAIPWDKMDQDFLEQPKKWEAGSIQRFMLWIGPISSIFDYVTFAIMFFIFKANSPEHQTLFQTGWFVEGLLSQTLIVHMIRTRKIPFIQSWASAPLTAVTSLIMLIAIAIPFTPIAASLKMQPLPVAYFPWLAGILLMYCLLTQLVKTWYIKKYNEWL